MTTVRLSGLELKRKSESPFIIGLQLVNADQLQITYVKGSIGATPKELEALKNMLYTSGWHFTYETEEINHYELDETRRDRVMVLTILALDSYDSFKWAALEQKIAECFWKVLPREEAKAIRRSIELSKQGKSEFQLVGDKLFF